MPTPVKHNKNIFWLFSSVHMPCYICLNEDNGLLLNGKAFIEKDKKGGFAKLHAKAGK